MKNVSVSKNAHLWWSMVSIRHHMMRPDFFLKICSVTLEPTTLRCVSFQIIAQSRKLLICHQNTGGKILHYPHMLWLLSKLINGTWANLYKTTWGVCRKLIALTSRCSSVSFNRRMSLHLLFRSSICIFSFLCSHCSWMMPLQKSLHSTMDLIFCSAEVWSETSRSQTRLNNPQRAVCVRWRSITDPDGVVEALHHASI